MGYPIEKKFVLAVASSALFDLTESDKVFREQSEEAYREFQRRNEDVPLERGIAFPLIRRLLLLNEDFPGIQPVEVVLISRNDPDTGLRVLNTIERLQLGISRAVFVKGRSPLGYIDCFNTSLFLSANPDDVRTAISLNLPAGCVHPGRAVEDDDERELRIAFDFDGVLADDSAEKVYRSGSLSAFLESENSQRLLPMPAGPLHRFLSEICRLQLLERNRKAVEPAYEVRIRTAIVTARNAPAHRRVISTLRDWGVQIDEAFFLGGIDKSKVLAEFRPHIFFDDQLTHVEDASTVAPVVHIPFGIANVRNDES